LPDKDLQERSNDERKQSAGVRNTVQATGPEDIASKSITPDRAVARQDQGGTMRAVCATGVHQIPMAEIEPLVWGWQALSREVQDMILAKCDRED
jgi:hypothetical protein